ncbi:unnamed protein product [Protopolystoma xenopodis]|uniref:Uncharacterized protein n=1 Tax=Protopolystoma xenopodis TaxID=117903 RepID=A0A3S5FGY1_9PLAT|nr:unnamed protein product [Protopolystoma xenopodis]
MHLPLPPAHPFFSSFSSSSSGLYQIGLTACFVSLKKNEMGPKKIEVLDMKRSNAINIGMKVLPPLNTISTALIKMESSMINREGIEVSSQAAC